MAYVLVQHLDPRHESILAALLSHATAMAVGEVKADVRVEPNRVYVIPPSEDIVLTDGMLRLVPRSQTGTAHMPVDSFLCSLAEVQGSQGIGVILSGLASDGTLGLKAIKAGGGRSLPRTPRALVFVPVGPLRAAALASYQDQNARRNAEKVQEYAQGSNQGDKAHHAHQDQPGSQQEHAEVLRKDDSHSEILLRKTVGWMIRST